MAPDAVPRNVGIAVYVCGYDNRHQFGVDCALEVCIDIASVDNASISRDFLALLRVLTIKNKNPLAVVVTDYTNQLPGSALLAPYQREPHSCFEMFAAVRLLRIDAVEACLYCIVWGSRIDDQRGLF